MGGRILSGLAAAVVFAANAGAQSKTAGEARSQGTKDGGARGAHSLRGGTDGK